MISKDFEEMVEQTSKDTVTLEYVLDNITQVHKLITRNYFSNDLMKANIGTINAQILNLKLYLESII